MLVVRAHALALYSPKSFSQLIRPQTKSGGLKSLIVNNCLRVIYGLALSNARC